MARITGIFDGLYVDQLFHKNERGETIYYPFGLMGRGYLLPSDREAQVRRATRRLTFFSLAAVVGFAFFSNFAFSQGIAQVAASVLAFLAIVGTTVYFQSHLASGLEPASGSRPSYGEWFRAGRAARPPWTHRVAVGMGLLSLLFAVAGFAMGFSEGAAAGYICGVFFLLVGAPLTWDGVLGLRERSRASGAK